LGVRQLIVVIETYDELPERRSKVVLGARKERLDPAERFDARARERKLFVVVLMLR
jgi:hypothetical protein